MSATEHAHEHDSLSGILAEAYGIFTDPAHILAEVGFAGVEGLIGAVVGAFLIRQAPQMVGANEVGPFCSVRLAEGFRRHIAVQAKPSVLAAVDGRIVTDDDRLSFEIIGHQDRNRALVILQHGYILGSHWLAYIDPSTIPAPVKV